MFASSFILSEFKPINFPCIPVLQILTKIGRVFMMSFFQFCIPCPGWWSSNFPCVMAVLYVEFPCCGNSLPSCHNAENTSAFPILCIPARTRRILCIILHVIMWRIMQSILCITAGMRRIGNTEKFSVLELDRGECIYTLRVISALLLIKCWDFSTLLSEKSH